MKLDRIASAYEDLCEDGIDCPAVDAPPQPLAEALVRAGGPSLLVRGYAVTDVEALAELQLPPGEAVVEIPVSLLVRAAAQLSGDGVSL